MTPRPFHTDTSPSQLTQGGSGTGSPCNSVRPTLVTPDQTKGTLGCLPDRDTAAVAEHTWKDHHSIRWEEATVVDKVKHPGDLPLKEALHILMIPAEEHLNRETSLEIPTLRKQKTSSKPRCSVTSGDTR